VVAVHDDLAFASARQLEITHEHIARVVITMSRFAVSLADILVAFTGVAIRRRIGRPASQGDPMHLNVLDILATLSWIAHLGSSSNTLASFRASSIWT
jgi:hypothetical protein